MPRVRVEEIKYCWFKDANSNEYCITASQYWKVGLKFDYEFTEQSSTLPPHFKFKFDLETKQSSFWKSIFTLKNPPVFYNSVHLEMPEFTYAIRFEVVYWLDQQALCLNFLTNWKPVKFKLTTNNKFGQCSKKIVNCLDDFSNWTDLEAKFLETCRQSPGTEYKLWEYEPIEKEEERYFFGNETYTPNYCWPGESPFYSPILSYPDNILLGIRELYTDIANFVDDANYIATEN